MQGKGRAQAGRKGCVGTWVVGEGCLCTITVWVEEKIQARTMRNKVRGSAGPGTHPGPGAGKGQGLRRQAQHPGQTPSSSVRPQAHEAENTDDITH